MLKAGQAIGWAARRTDIRRSGAGRRRRAVPSSVRATAPPHVLALSRPGETDPHGVGDEEGCVDGARRAGSLARERTRHRRRDHAPDHPYAGCRARRSSSTPRSTGAPNGWSSGWRPRTSGIFPDYDLVAQCDVSGSLVRNAFSCWFRPSSMTRAGWAHRSWSCRSSTATSPGRSRSSIPGSSHAPRRAQPAHLYGEGVDVVARLHRLDPDGVPASIPREHRRGAGRVAGTDWYADGDRRVPALHRLRPAPRQPTARRPARLAAAGDVRLNAIVDDQADVVAVLDWQMTTVGAAEHDLAWWQVLKATQDELVGRRVDGFPSVRRAPCRLRARPRTGAPAHGVVRGVRDAPLVGDHDAGRDPRGARPVAARCSRSTRTPSSTCSSGWSSTQEASHGEHVRSTHGGRRGAHPPDRRHLRPGVARPTGRGPRRCGPWPPPVDGSLSRVVRPRQVRQPQRDGRVRRRVAPAPSSGPCGPAARLAPRARGHRRRARSPTRSSSRCDATRIALGPNDVVPISFDIEIDSDVPPGVEDREVHISRSRYRIDADVVRFHQSGVATGWVEVDGERVEIGDGPGSAPATARGACATASASRSATSRTTPETAGDLHARALDAGHHDAARRPLRTRCSSTTSATTATAGRPAARRERSSCPTAAARRSATSSPQLAFEDGNRRLIGGDLRCVNADGTERVLRVEPVCPSRVPPRHRPLRRVRGPRARRVPGRAARRGRARRALRRRSRSPIASTSTATASSGRRRPVDGSTGVGTLQSIVAGAHPELGLTEEASFS